MQVVQIKHGRPATLSKVVQVRLRPDEQRTVAKAAKAGSLSFSAWAREVLVRTAEDELNRPHSTS